MRLALLAVLSVAAAGPQSADECFQTGNKKLVKKDYDGAIADYTKAIKLEPKHVSAYYNCGLARNAKGDLDGAIADFTRAIELNPKYATAYYNRGTVKATKGDRNGAIADFTRAIELNSKYDAAYNNRGITKKAKGDLDGAIADYTKAIELDPRNGRTYDNRADAKKAKGDLDGAIADYTKAIELDPKYPTYYASRGYVEYDRRSWTDSLSDFRKACELDAKNDNARFRIWLIRTRLDEGEAATKELARCWNERRSGSPDDWPSKIVRFLTGDLSEEDFLKAADHQDGKIAQEQRCEAFFYAGSKCLFRGDKEKATSHFGKCLDTGVKNFREYESAAAEIEFLKADK